ncbi:DUF488 domain-containing protein [Bradyrhizobium japonicum]|uniref:DUF488 domain-containing protein n=1 Tax=Bradyrhizobium japonicum TaxID=375 RepID=UPI000456EBE1|nr:DUF488 domain-containing protein [Bradyrhizobium japonicum]AHY55739.1 hypothetical protein BJS_05267 [Bradyrhizobium japonicum SEMIA 5079]MCD9107715.1 DUF488 domain-containing protein [Bradyrhizobium japonicum]MCD9252120.1 DUF488 domain-containing protein [Bradyrhizobium japonicum SEMIA 5079]MCD9816578.1 DUF488 domain-containing protein [Bradyrhizobium japonicum]MCD9893086.1 DUF488 domain-containing protein [Bradyrhizobium japonicum]
MTETVFTIGHSTQPVDRFIELLKKHGITAVADVRSKPYSRMNPQFNREDLKKALRDAKIKYVFLGKELGARSEDQSCYCNGQVQYDRLAKTDLFKKGIERVREGSIDYRIALMCAEKEPLDCHRTILVARELADEGVPIVHILYNGQAEKHEDAIGRLISMMRIPNADMFREQSTVIRDAYEKRGKEIAYREEEPVLNEGQQASTRCAE